ncbi:GNAT family N-acetyltransferase [Thalassospira sp.]|uniref:GNAT family N-acetyltransferase n=1 Tax=Thalassospira sp. TaxID=1912094 RepID=UPI0025D14872|nr:GNAT family N-acetyltransferase [Thalassospira sp.]
MAFHQSEWQSNILRRDDPAETSYGVTLRFLETADLNDLVELHQAVVANLPDRHIFRSDQPDFLADHIERRGATVGAFKEGRLIGYAVVSFPYQDPDNLARFTDLPADEALRVAHFDGAAVHPDFRGNHLHQTMNQIRGHYALLAGYHHLMGTVSPLNPYSLGNHLGAGFQVIGHAVCYGDMQRYIIHRKGHPTSLQRPRNPEDKELISCPVDAFFEVSEHLAHGYIGFAVQRTSSGKYLLQMALRDTVTSDTNRAFRT